MASAGKIFRIEATTDRPTSRVIQLLVQAVAGEPGYSITSARDDSLTLTRTYSPTRTLAAVPIVGWMMLLYKSREVLTIKATNERGSTRISVAGLATPEMEQRILRSLAAAGAKRAPARQQMKSNSPIPYQCTCPVCGAQREGKPVCRSCGFTYAN